MLTPNSEVSRTASIRISANECADILRRVVLDKPSNPVRVLFTDEGVSVWTHDLAKTIQVLITDADVALKVKEPCVLLIDPEPFANLLDKKFSGEMVQITTKANRPIVIKNRAGAKSVFHPADEDDCFLIPDRWLLPKNDDGWFILPMKDNEVCTTKVTIDRHSLANGMTDMKVANAPYVVFNFGPKKSSCSSGHWGTKTNQSHTNIKATVEGDETEVVFTESLGVVLSHTDEDTFVLYKHKDIPFVVVESGDTTIIATEAQRES